MAAKPILPVRTDDSERLLCNPALVAPIATMDETLEVNAAARDQLVKARKAKGVTGAGRLAIDKALGQLALSSESTGRALALARRAAGVTA